MHRFLTFELHLKKETPTLTRSKWSLYKHIIYRVRLLKDYEPPITSTSSSSESGSVVLDCSVFCGSLSFFGRFTPSLMFIDKAMNNARIVSMILRIYAIAKARSISKRATFLITELLIINELIIDFHTAK